MNIMSKLKSKQKALIVAGSLLFGVGLALTSTASIAANAEYERHRNNEIHNTNKQHGNQHPIREIEHYNNGHHNIHTFPERRHHSAKRHHDAHHHKHYYRNHHHKKHYHGKPHKYYHGKPHYALSHDHHYHHPDRFDLEIGVYTDNLDIIMRD